MKSEIFSSACAVANPIRYFVVTFFYFFGALSFPYDIGRIAGIVHGSMLASIVGRVIAGIIYAGGMLWSARKNHINPV